MANAPTMTEMAQLRWRCRRGMRELDLLMGRWLDNCYSDSTHEQQAGFRQLLESPDPQLFDWLIGRERPGDAALARLVDVIRGDKV